MRPSMVRRTDPRSARDSLARIPLFAALLPDQIAALDAACSWRRVDAGAAIIDHQDDGIDVFFVVHGHVRVMIRQPGGQSVILRDIGDGEFFGELAAIDGQPRSAGIQAVTAATVARMPAAVFRGAIHAHPSVSDQVLALLAGQVRMLATRVTEFSTLNVRHRLYAELLRLSRPDPREPAHAIISPPPIQADLAARISSHREAVSRELAALTRAGLLDRRRGALVLLDPARLRQLVEEAYAGG